MENQLRIIKMKKSRPQNRQRMTPLADGLASKAIHSFHFDNIIWPFHICWTIILLIFVKMERKKDDSRNVKQQFISNQIVLARWLLVLGGHPIRHTAQSLSPLSDDLHVMLCE